MRTTLRWTIGIIIIIHGLIHLLGAAKAFGWAAAPSLSQPVSPAAGLLWLAGAILTVLTGALLIACAHWWAIALVAALVSQAAIATSWNDAKAGTIGNVVLAVAACYGFRSHGPASFRARFRKLALHTTTAATSTTADVNRSTVTESDLAHLPPAVADYLRATGAIGRPHVVGFRARISGRIRSGPNQPWMRWVGEQVNTFGAAPSRVLYMDATMKGLPTDVLHTYVGPHASMQVRVASLLTVVDARGPDMDQAETVTLLNDMCVLAPAALVGAPIQWTAIDTHHAKATYANAGHIATGVLVFNDAHELIDFVSDDRLRSSPDGHTLTPERWSTPIIRYEELDGRRICSLGHARWHPAEAPPFDYLEFHTDDLQYIEPGHHATRVAPATTRAGS